MIFNDFVITLNEQMDNLEKLNYIIDELEDIITEQKAWVHNTFISIYNKSISSSYNSNATSNANNLIEETQLHYKNLRQRLIEIDFLEFGEILSNFKNVGLPSIEEETNKNVEEFKKTYRIIHEYRKFTNSTDITLDYVNCIDAIRNMVDIFRRFQYLVRYINNISVQLNGNYSDVGLEIRLLTERIEKDSYNKVVEPAYEIYNKLCEIASINSQLDELKIIRMETGSLFIKFIGNNAIIKVMSKMLESAHDIFIRNCTREGQRKNLVESTELFKQQFDIIAEMRKMGLDVSEHQEIAKETLVLLMKQSNTLLSSSPDVKINNKVLSKSEGIKNILKENSYKLIEDNNVVLNE